MSSTTWGLGLKPFRIWTAAVLLGAIGVAATPAPATAASWKLTAGATSATTATVTSTFTAPANQSGVQLDTEVYDSKGTKVAQWFKTANVTANRAQTFTYSWNTSGKPAGTYTVKLGVFDSTWKKLLAWNDKAATFAVGTQPATVSFSSGNPGNNPLAGTKFWGVNQNALQQANAWRSYRAGDAGLMDRLAYTPTAQWFGNWNTDVRSSVAAAVSDAGKQNATAVLVAYNIVGRDCSGHSSGGASDEGAYNRWISDFAAGIHGPAVVVLEPDALAQLCGDQSARYRMLSNAVDRLSSAGARVYIDAGHASWIAPSVMADRLNRAGVSRAAGFAVNVANFYATGESQSYAEQISSHVGGKGYVVDTSRNGNGSSGQWCNPTDASVGQSPTANTSGAHAHAYLWVKNVGDSDGYCNGGPGAGQWSSDIAMKLTLNWR